MPEETRIELEMFTAEPPVGGNASMSQDAFLPIMAQRLKDNSDRENRNQLIREQLVPLLSWVSICWLIFTGIVVLLVGFHFTCFCLDNSVMIAFLTTSLGTVLGVWGIALYFFFPHNKS
jgi:hypothetical protein